MPRRAPRPRSAVSSFFAGTAALAAAAVPILVLAVLAPAQASAQSAVAYVALGDSYSSGVGAGSYIGSSGSCDRSTNSYPALWDAANQPASYVSEACSGATTATVLSSQLSALSPASAAEENAVTNFAKPLWMSTPGGSMSSARLSLSMVASLQCLLLFRPARSL